MQFLAVDIVNTVNGQPKTKQTIFEKKILSQKNSKPSSIKSVPQL